MRNATFLGLCLATTFGLVAVALAQQPAATQPAQPGQQPAVQIGAVNQQPGAGDTPLFNRQPLGEPAPFNSGSSNGTGAAVGQNAGAPPDRSMLQGSPREADNSQITGSGQPRGELGVWLVESGGPGVEISRITDGSAAKQAGLRSGDVILQVNGRGASSPEATAQLIRQIPIGQSATLTIWRDGEQQQMQVAIQPVREVHQVAFRDEGNSANSNLASRTMRLEQQLGTIAQELQQLKQEMAQLRTSHGQATDQNASAAQSTDPLAPPPGFERADQKATQPSGTPGANEAPTSTPNDKNAKTGADPFNNEPAPPKAGETPKEGAEPKAGSDSKSLFE